MIQATNEHLVSEECCLDKCTKPSVPPKPRPPRITIPEGKTFLLQVNLLLYEESDSEVTQLHVYHYNYTKLHVFKTEDFDINIKSEEKTRHHEQKIEVNIIDET